MNGIVLFGFHRAALIDRLTDHIDDAPQRFGADRHRNRRASVANVMAANQALRAVHRNGPNGILAKVLRNLQDKPVALVFGLQRIQDRR